MTRRLSQEKQRLKYFLWTLIQKHHPNCCICNQPFVKEDVLPARGTDNLTEHHFDGNHDNMKLENRGLSHRRCHKAHHTRDNVNRRKDEGKTN